MDRVTQDPKNSAKAPPDKHKQPYNAESQKRYRANVQRRLQALAEIQAVIANLKESEE